MKKNGAEIIVDALIREHVDTLFAYPGGVVIPLFDALHDTKKIRVIINRHEQATAHAADGYARASGRVGVCLVTSGPGATNLVTGLATAYHDSIPMVAITGQVTSDLIGTDAFQEADICCITRTITKHNFLVQRVEQLPSIIKKAFYIARSGRPGPVLIDVPVDVSKAYLETYTYPDTITISSYSPYMHPNEDTLIEIARLLMSTNKPVIYAGGGIISANAAEELQAFTIKTNIPITTTLMGLGAFPMNHPLFLGMPGMHGTKQANYALQQADLIFAIGVRFDDRVVGKAQEFAPKATIIHCDIDPAVLSKIIPAHHGVVGDAGEILQKLTPLIVPKNLVSWHKQIAQWKNSCYQTTTHSTQSIKPQFVIEKLFNQTKGEAIITTEVGQSQMWTAHYYAFTRPRTFLTSGGLGTMGYGLPAAIGAALALNRPVIDIAGDGSIQMNIQEFATIALNHIPVKVIILNNEYLGMVRQWQELFYKKRYYGTCLKADSLCNQCTDPSTCKKKYLPDFIAIAQSYGIPAFRGEQADDVERTLQKGLLGDGPAVIEFMIEREENVFPIVPAGCSIDTILEAS